MAPLQSIHNQQPAAALVERREAGVDQPTTIERECWRVQGVVPLKSCERPGAHAVRWISFFHMLSFRFLPFFIVRSSKARCPGMWPG